MIHSLIVVATFFFCLWLLGYFLSILGLLDWMHRPHKTDHAELQRLYEAKAEQEKDPAKAEQYRRTAARNAMRHRV
jgi:hypothetical protein